MKAPSQLDSAPADYRAAFERLTDGLAQELNDKGWQSGVDWAEIERCAEVLKEQELKDAEARYWSVNDRIANYYAEARRHRFTLADAR